jgi:WD40 repeat protein
VFESEGQIWAVRDTGSLLHRVSREPVQLTAGAVSYRFPVSSKDGKTLFAIAGFRRAELQRYDAKAETFQPFLSGISARTFPTQATGNGLLTSLFLMGCSGAASRTERTGSSSVLPRFMRCCRDGQPDGSEIVFYDVAPGKPSRLYQVPAAGGVPQPLMPDDSGPQVDPVWSSDGNSLAFSGQGGGGATTIQILDMRTRKITTLPNSDGLFSPRWSPDGQYLAAMRMDSTGIMLFDFKTQKWSVLTKGILGYPCWSRNGRFLYFLRGTTSGAGLMEAVERLQFLARPHPGQRAAGNQRRRHRGNCFHELDAP